MYMYIYTYIHQSTCLDDYSSEATNLSSSQENFYTVATVNDNQLSKLTSKHL